jgi:tetratricopeptide (TPR) repeat protein
LTYTSAAGYSARGFVAADDICGDLEVYSKSPISADDPAVHKIFATFELDKSYTPQFGDIVFYAQVLFQTHLYRAAAPTFEQALAVLPADGKPFASAKLARRIVTDQAGIAYGMDGELANSKAIFESAIAADPEYPMYYYNLACADAAEKNLNAARVHLKQAFDRKMNMNPGETMPDPTKDDSFLPYANRKDFWEFVSNLPSK